MMKSSVASSDSKPKSLRERAEKATSNHIQKELSPVLEAVKRTQQDTQSCARQMQQILRLQNAPRKNAGAMLWGIVMGVLIYAFLQPRIEHSNHACMIGSKIVSAWPSMSESQRTVIHTITDE
ncbi:MAG: hypothetical protein OXE59_08130 [Bacteroidetes bacterium]|nr:hypothetical protein [Bacteroidota bacterium]